MRRLALIFAVATITVAGGHPAHAESKGYYVGKNGEFLPMRCTINGTPRNSVSACSAAAKRVHAYNGWSQASGPGVPAYYETGLPTPHHGRRHVHNQPVLHVHRLRHGTYRHYGYLGHHQNRKLRGIPNRIVHTGSGRATYVVQRKY